MGKGKGKAVHVLHKNWFFSLKEARFDLQDLGSAEGGYVDINRKSKVKSKKITSSGA